MAGFPSLGGLKDSPIAQGLGYMYGGGLVGLAGMAGAQRDSNAGYQEGAITQDINLRNFEDINKGQSNLEQIGYNQQVSGFGELQKLFGMGPGANEVQANTQYQNQFADQLQSVLQRMQNPSASDISQNFSQAQQLFAPQQVALNQQFQDQNTASNRLSARLGRAGNDPILRNKLAQEQTRQQSSLNANIGSYAQQLPQMQAQDLVNFGGQLSNLRQGLASQAFQNRQTLLGLGNQLTNAERQYRLQTARKSGSSYQHGDQLSGGGTKEGLGAATSMAGSIASMFSDARGKKSLARAPRSTSQDMLDNLKPYTYDYKEPKAVGTAEGRRYGILAQDLEKSEAGKTIVMDTPQGKMIDTIQGFGLVLATLADINDRLKKLEEK